MTTLTAIDGTPASSLCFGCMQFGGTADETASRAMFDACRAAGVTFFDTAHVYTDGRSETMLGTFAEPERDGLVIATKANYARGAGRENILGSLDDSRKRLGTEVIDLLYLHRWDAETPLEESFEALARLRDQGTIRYVGVSNFAAWQVMKAQAVAATFGIRIDAIQPMYNLVKRQAEVEILLMARDQDIAVVPYSPLGGGLLSGKYARGGSGRLTRDDRYAARYAPDWMHDAARGLADLADEVGMHPATLAVAWVAANPAVTAPIVSARDTDQLGPSLAAADVALDDDLLARITALSPAPPPATDRLEEA
ncbi:aldo/keto reductase [Jannaschia rubra]|uniref:L-glyceraldehyde 3-phosphate reductase n=1 Tax=Jannaschia rubra TaxID=282197 RepID=A0A0M6XTF6_9RHOB|nr:aldo/keto reductase [Jannaschia rubra]CTQ33511.1 L-glyceraldehyde 3-phosphate reductase [Jannaschia rubra]SFG02987.1 Predicted oxidoreductase [Jannaschia rubra]